MKNMTMTGDHIPQALAGKQPVAQDDCLGFACQGCGHLCCVNTDVLIPPPEAARITWLLERHPGLCQQLKSPGIRWGELFLGGSTGLPLLQLHFTPFDEAHPEWGRRCPFLAPVYDKGGQWAKMAWCVIREARPAVCRLFPVGRLKDNTRSPEWQYYLMAHCPGFTATAPGQATPPGYAWLNDRQTIREWVAAQHNPEQDEENGFYVGQVIPAYMTAGVHADAKHNAGKMSRRLAIALGEKLFYNPPPAPADPAQDHAVIMEWLAYLRDLAAPIEAMCRKASRSAAVSQVGLDLMR